MKSHFLKLLTFLSLLAPSFAHEGPWTASRPDGHAPISVMGDHMHEMGEWMVSYRYMTMGMEHLLKGSDSVAPTMMATGFMPNMLPTEMTMDMHMFGTMYAFSNKWTLMGMLNYLENEMSMPMGKMDSSGLGDIKVAGLYDLAQWNDGRRVHLKLGLNLPTGSIDEKDSMSRILGYGMQLGSGTYDLEPAITYLGQTESYSYGAQLGGILRIGENDQDYTLGNKFEASLWGARKITESLSASAKFDYSSQSEVDGAHKGLTTMQKNMSPGNQASSQGRDITTFGLGLNYYFQEGGLKGHRFAAEWETPIDQKVNGVQLELDSVWTLGWQYAW
ncbi:MAG: transporter [Opitutales bacterium]